MNDTIDLAEATGFNKTEELPLNATNANATDEILSNGEHQTVTLILGVQSIVGTVWWLFIMLVTIKNADSDPNLTLFSGEEVVPIHWIWERIGEVGGIYNYLAASLCFTFLLYFIVSVLEMVTWILYIADFAPSFMKFYFSTVGYWGSLIGYAIPWILAVVHLCTQMLGNTSWFPGSWSLTLFIIGSIFWITIGNIHVHLVPKFLMKYSEEPDTPYIPTVYDPQANSRAYAEAYAAANAKIKAEAENLFDPQAPVKIEAKAEETDKAEAKEEPEDEVEVEAEVIATPLEMTPTGEINLADIVCDCDVSEDVELEVGIAKMCSKRCKAKKWYCPMDKKPDQSITDFVNRCKAMTKKKWAE
jgi:hypothetical protein